MRCRTKAFLFFRLILRRLVNNNASWKSPGPGLVVNMPPLRAREGDRQRKTLRRVLLDRADLDAFIEARKGRSG
jgi:hypothetical protein